MKDIKLFIQGFIVGIGKIIPGVSGAMFAMMFGIYEKSLNIIGNLKTELRKNIKYVLILVVSIGLAIIFGSNIIKKCLDNYYFITMMLFLGMMCAGIKPLFNSIKGEKIKISNILWASLVVGILVALSFVEGTNNDGILNKNIFTFLELIFAGFLDALATVIPGVCGTALLMILGYYDKVITSLGDLLNLSNFSNNAFILIPFGIGLFLGIYLVSKLVNYLFKNHKVKTHYSIIGFAITSIILLFMEVFEKTYNKNEIIIGCLLFIIGFILVYILGKKNKE